MHNPQRLSHINRLKKGFISSHWEIFYSTATLCRHIRPFHYCTSTFYSFSAGYHLVKTTAPFRSLHLVISQPSPLKWVLILPFVTYDLVCAQYWPRDEVVEAWTPSSNDGPQIDGLFDVNQLMWVCVVCMCVSQWIQPDVLVSAVQWQREDVWGNKKRRRLMLMWPHLCARTHLHVQRQNGGIQPP